MQAILYPTTPWFRHVEKKTAHGPVSGKSHGMSHISWASGIATTLVTLWIIGLGPLFILCLIFEQTKGMFHRWLMYGIGTLFSMAVLNLVTSIVLKLSLGVAAGMWTTGLLQRVFTGNVEGLSHLALEQGGLGMILTLLIVTVPPMAASFFQGTLGNFMQLLRLRRLRLPRRAAGTTTGAICASSRNSNRKSWWRWRSQQSQHRPPYRQHRPKSSRHHQASPLQLGHADFLQSINPCRHKPVIGILEEAGT